MKTILLTRNQVALVSDEDFEYLSGFNWCLQSRLDNRTSYAIRKKSLYERDDIKSGIILHRVIAERMGLDLTNCIDHIDGDGLNNQRENLRSATTRQNSQNQTHKRKGCSSKYKGVFWNTRDKKWQSQIYINSAQVQLGQFVKEEDAAEAYNEAATKHYGEFAALNKIGYLDIIPLAINQEKMIAQNRKGKECSSKYKGVYWNKRSKKWHTQITINYVGIYLGQFVKEHEAAAAYNEAATKHYGEFAALNIILEQQIN